MPALRGGDTSSREGMCGSVKWHRRDRPEACGIVRSHMSNTRLSDLGLGLLLLPAGLLFIVLIVAGLFLFAHDTPSLDLSMTAQQHLVV